MSQPETNPAEAMPPERARALKMWETRRKNHPKLLKDYLKNLADADLQAESNAIMNAFKPSPTDIGCVMVAMCRHRATYFDKHNESLVGYLGMPNEELERDSGLIQSAFCVLAEKEYSLIRYRQIGDVTYWDFTWPGIQGIRYYGYYNWKKLISDNIPYAPHDQAPAIKAGFQEALSSPVKKKLESVAENNAKTEPAKAPETKS